MRLKVNSRTLDYRRPDKPKNLIYEGTEATL